MPLSKRQKRRLLEVSKMIESSIVVKDDMEECMPQPRTTAAAQSC